MRFRDLQSLTEKSRRPQSPVLQFYSSVANIGNYLPVAAIRDMIDIQTDTWCIHHPVDFDFVNRNYSAVIIGGAGLLHRCFNRFWDDFSQRCDLPVAIWGVGVCVPDGIDPVAASCDRDAVRNVADRCELVNVRDDITADLYGLRSAHVTPCPTVAYLQKWPATTTADIATVSEHDGLATNDEHARIRLTLKERGWRVRRTKNTQSRLVGVDDIISRRYVGSGAVVTTRLHGAIIAYGLGIPYVALARDEKLRDFHRLYGGGCIIESPMDLPTALDTLPAHVDRANPDSVLRFGSLASGWLASLDRRIP